MEILDETNPTARKDYYCTNPTARKDYYCMGCGRVIKKGEKYLRQVVVDGSDIWAWRSCNQCEKFVKDYFTYAENGDGVVTADSLRSGAIERALELGLLESYNEAGNADTSDIIDCILKEEANGKD